MVVLIMLNGHIPLFCTEYFVNIEWNHLTCSKVGFFLGAGGWGRVCFPLMENCCKYCFTIILVTNNKISVSAHLVVNSEFDSTLSITLI